MFNLQTIHKPTSLLEALTHLQQPATAVMAGGTDLISARRRDIHTLVDLSALDLAGIELQENALFIGATTTLADAAASPLTRKVADGVLAQAARGTHASILRNQATVAGTLIAEPDGIFAVTLLALDARLCISTLVDARVETAEALLRDVFKQHSAYLQNSIVIAVLIPAAVLSRRAVIETVARTPRDKAIVSVCAALQIERGIVQNAGIALGGVAETAWRAADAEREVLQKGLTDDIVDRAAMAAVSGLKPRGDYRGSAAYRLEMARALTARGLRELRGRD